MAATRRPANEMDMAQARENHFSTGGIKVKKSSFVVDFHPTP